MQQEPIELLPVCRYYPLNMTYFKSGLDSHMLDLLWNKYWVNTLSSSPLLGTRDLTAGQIADIGEPCAEAAIHMHCTVLVCGEQCWADLLSNRPLLGTCLARCSHWCTLMCSSGDCCNILHFEQHWALALRIDKLSSGP